MSVDRANDLGLKRLHRVLLLSWTAAWCVGVGALALFVVHESQRWHQRDLDGQLELYATAAYGLTWFDEQGEFHAEDFHAEPDLASGVVDIFVVQPGSPMRVLLAPAEPRFDVRDLGDLAAESVSTGRELLRDGNDVHGQAYRSLAIPTYASDAEAAPIASVVVLADPNPILRAHVDFARRVGFSALALGLLGLGVGMLLARASVQPVARALEQRERFLLAAAHELRTPTSALAAVVESAVAGDEPAEKALRRLQPLTRRTAEVVDELLLFARLDAGGASLTRENLRLDLLVEACLPEESALALHSDECVASVDPRLARVAVRNIVANALRHAGAGEQPAQVSVSAAVVTVEDEGPGFSAELLELVSGAFRVAPSQGGAGLGLATAKLIAELHGGHLELANRSGGGARVTLSFG